MLHSWVFPTICTLHVREVDRRPKQRNKAQHVHAHLGCLQGLAPNYVKVVPSIAIAFVTYEQVKEMLGVEFRISE